VLVDAAGQLSSMLGRLRGAKEYIGFILKVELTCLGRRIGAHRGKMVSYAYISYSIRRRVLVNLGAALIKCLPQGIAKNDQ
jgi:hypothetical protein